MRNERMMVVFCLTGLLASGAHGADSYDDLLALARKHDSAMVRAEARLAAVKADSRITRAGLYPKLDANVGVNHINQTVQNYQSGTQKGSVIGYNYGVFARINALHVPTLMQLNVVDASLRMEEAAVRSARQELVVRFVDAYVGLLKAQQDYQITLKELDRVKQVHEQSQMFLKAGMGDIIAVHEAKARMDSVVAELNRFEGSLRLAEQKLSTVVGKQVTDVQDSAFGGAQGPQPESLSWWLEMMEKQDPLIRQRAEGVERAAQELRAVKAEHLPVVQASGGYVSSKGSVFLPEVETRQWYLGASVSIPLYSGGETTAKTQRAVAYGAEQKGALDELRKQRSEQLKQSYYGLIYNVALVKSLEKRLESSSLQLEAVKKGRSIGTRSAIDVLNAEQAYSMALRDHRNALYDNKIKVILLKSAAGLLEDDGKLDGAPTVVEKTEQKPSGSLSKPDEQQIVGFGTGVVIGPLGRQGIKFHTSPDGKGAVLSACPNGDTPPMLTANIWDVQDKKDNWLKISCGPAAGSVWVQMQQGLQYLTWKEYLKNRKVLLPKGLPSDSYRVLDSKGTEVKKALAPEEIIDVAGVVENWVLVKVSPTEIGWLLWRDKQGRMLIRVAE